MSTLAEEFGWRQHSEQCGNVGFAQRHSFGPDALRHVLPRLSISLLWAVGERGEMMTSWCPFALVSQCFAE